MASLIANIRYALLETFFCIPILPKTDAVIPLSRRISFEELTAPLLTDYRFLLVGKGQVANMEFVQSLEGSELLMKNGDKLSVSRAKRAEVSADLVRFQFSES